MMRAFGRVGRVMSFGLESSSAVRGLAATTRLNLQQWPGRVQQLPALLPQVAGAWGRMLWTGRTCPPPPLLPPLALTPWRGLVVRRMGHARKLKTKQSAAKRFLVTGKGELKRGHAYKGHLTSGKSKTRLRRLNTKVLLTGTTAKKMKSLLISGK